MGPSQPSAIDMPNKNFPECQSSGRRFHESWYWRKLPSGETTRRKWLSYSITENKLYCLYCALFGRGCKENWSKIGFCNFRKGAFSIAVHETSEPHILASIKVAYREAAFPIIPSLKEAAVANVAFNQEVVRHLIDITLFLGRHSLPFRGHREGWDESNKGNFKDLVLLLAKYSPALSSYVSTVKAKGRKMVNFISWERQNQLILAITKHIQEIIKKEITSSVFFSCSLDTTFDLSKKEQLSLVIRYINQDNGNVCERLIALRETVLTSGQHLLTMFDGICSEMNLNWKTNLIGQSYDGAASMRGTYNGLQAFIKQQNPSATYVWCWAHRFNLVIVDAVSCCSEARDLFGNLEILYTFMGSSKKRTHCFTKHQELRYPGKPLRRLKRVETTRWSSHSSALMTIFCTYEAIVDALDELKNDSTTDRVSSVQAEGLLHYLFQERFLLTALCFKNIFDTTSILSKCLQTVDIDLLAAINYMQNCLAKMKKFRCDEEFNKLLEEKENFIESKEDITFIPLPSKRVRRVKIRAGETSSDESIIDPIQNFKINVYFTIVDIVITQISDRFNDHSVPLFKDLALFSHKRLEEVAKTSYISDDAFKAFCDVYSQFVELNTLRKEYIQFSSCYCEFEKIMILPQKMHNDELLNESEEEFESDEEPNNIPSQNKKKENCESIEKIYKICRSFGLKEIFPHMYTALSIALTLPVSSTSPERAFSKLKLIKNRLRSTMNEERLEALMIMSCELDVPIDVGTVISLFASNSSALAKLLF